MDGKQARQRVLLLLTSLSIGVLFVFLGRFLISVNLKNPVFVGTFPWVINHVGSAPVMIVTGSILITITYFILKQLNFGADSRSAGVEIDKEKGKVKWLDTIRWRFLYLFLASIMIAVFVVITGETILYYAVDVWRLFPNNAFMNWIFKDTQTTATLMAVTGCLFFLLIFYGLTKRMIGYLKEITSGLQEISKGRLNYEIPVKSTDELGVLAYNINLMSKQLGLSMEEERRAEKTKNDLITGVSHDLRTPLTSILGFLELVEEDRYQDEVELRYYVNIAYEKSISLQRLIDDLFEYTKYSNELELGIKEMDVAGFIRQLAEEFVPSLEKAGMECRVYSDDEPRIAADGESLARAFGNLFMNAINYGAEGKRIDIIVSREEDEAVIAFKNYGEAIPEQNLPHLFERFYRVEQSRSKKTGGTGLGLAIVKSIVTRHNGTISVASNRKETVFEVRFPLYSAP
ncbi:sensor histidine kinase [Cohnella soli]|uniref:histidine kinase n=1 Tax=Cohnella soli TaxID=425005 RepID=A0ABW0HT15_9BACL